MNIKKYRKKPIIIEAYRTNKEMMIPTLEGNMKADIGDYIITGLRDEIYPCKPDIFNATYEEVPETEIVTHAISNKREKVKNLSFKEVINWHKVKYTK